jgi:hypothetical protein
MLQTPCSPKLAADLVPDRPPMPTPADARRGAADRWPDADAWTIVRALARAVCDPEHTPDLGCLRLDGDRGRVGLRGLATLRLRAGRRPVLALDATGEIDRLQWESLAARYGRTLAPVIVTAIGEKPASAEHYQTERLRTGRLWARKGRRVAFLADAPGAIRNALLRAAGAAPCALGVLTHKPAADALRWGRDLAADPDATPPDGAAFELDDCHARAVAELAAELCERGWQLEIGHFGRDDRASNAFERVDSLAILGAPRPDWGAVAEDARDEHACNAIDAEKLAEARTKAAAVQALARARHLRRGRRVRLFFAADCEAPTGAELPGVVWTVEHRRPLARPDRREHRRRRHRRRAGRPRRVPGRGRGARRPDAAHRWPTGRRAPVPPRSGAPGVDSPKRPRKGSRLRRARRKREQLPAFVRSW